jgi:nicotinate-nucleotide adenylyltransferase
MDSIGLYGGTFNPIHLGHLKAAEAVTEAFGLDRVLFIPSYIPPHKESREVASAAHRLRMVELALEGHDRFAASDIEVAAGGRSYSIVTVRKIKGLYPEAELFFILGVDAFLEIGTWREYEALLAECRFIVTSRPGWKLDASGVLGGRLRGSISPLIDGIMPGNETRERYRIFPLAIDALKISSTEVRARARQGLSLEGLVPPAVERYIRQNELYSR